MNTPPAERRARTDGGWVALAWGIAAAALLLVAAPWPGISHAEAAAISGDGPSAGAVAAASARPAVMAAVLAAAGATATRLGFPRLAGYRAVSAIAGGALAALLAMLARAVAGPAAALAAPALLLCAPRLLAPLLEAGPIASGAALAVGSILAYRTASAVRRAPARLAAALASGALFAVALALDALSVELLAVAALHALGCAALGALRRGHANRDGAPRFSPASVAAMLLLGPLLALALLPWPPAAALQLLARAIAGLHASRPAWGQQLAVTGLALPAALLLAILAGVAHAALRLWRAARGGLGLSDELLLLLAAVGPLAAAQAGLGSREPGPGPWLSAFPFLSILAARALVAAGRAAWPSRAMPVAAVLVALVVAPGAVASARAFPALSASWGELAGGAPGAATLGLPRQDGGSVASLLREIDARARPGARIFWAAVPAAAVTVYAGDRRLRPDLEVAAGPEDADLAVVSVSAGSREAEYRVWAAFHSSAPVAGSFLDEVPLAWVYARPGAWR